MSQHDLVIANQGFAAFRSDLNNLAAALASTSSGTSRPSGVVAYQQWVDTDTPSATVNAWNMYDGSDDIEAGLVDVTNNRFQVWGGSAARVVSQTTGFTIARTDRGLLHACSHASGFTITLLAAATAGNGFSFDVIVTGAGAITLDGNSSETVDGQTTMVLPPGLHCRVVCDGSNWRTIAHGWRPSAMSAHKNGTDQTGIVTATPTKVTFGTEIYDFQGEFASSTFTAQVAGIYAVRASVQFNSVADGTQCITFLYKNGAEHKRGQIYAGAGSAAVIVPVNADVQLAATDTVEIYCQHNHGSNRDLEGDAERTWLMVRKVA